MIYFGISLRDGDGTIEKLGVLQFASFNDAYSDVCSAIPDAMADLVRAGKDPARYAFLISDEEDRHLCELPLDPTLRSADDRRNRCPGAE